ncbi:MAG: translesion error-prone DNA polymerase V autoproteolytic subunit [Sedimentisphaerales bacterium]|nr:translesion error-prone DNA polymerase V autoproteolytic subunit [Sedimentisphaerales bacterium]
MSTVQVFYSARVKHNLLLPLQLERVAAGFPSPADDYMEGRLDLNQFLIEHPAATYYVRAGGDSMIGAGIHDGDILVVDRAVAARNGSVVIAAIDGELTVKRLHRNCGGIQLLAENENYPPQHVCPDAELTIWGVVRYVIHAL